MPKTPKLETDQTIAGTPRPIGPENAGRPIKEPVEGSQAIEGSTLMAPMTREMNRAPATQAAKAITQPFEGTPDDSVPHVRKK